MKKIKLIAEILVEIGETEDDYCSEGDLPINLRASIEDFIEWQEMKYTCNFKIIKTQIEKVKFDKKLTFVCHVCGSENIEPKKSYKKTHKYMILCNTCKNEYHYWRI